MNILYQQIKEDEGVRYFPYTDKTGQRVRPGEKYEGFLTIGIGHNMEEGFTETQIQHLLANKNYHRTRKTLREDLLRDGVDNSDVKMLYDTDMSAVIKVAEKQPWWKDLPADRKRVVLNMAFNMGTSKVFGPSGFKNTFASLQDAVKNAPERVRRAKEKEGLTPQQRKTFLKNLEVKDYTAVAEGMMDSKWFYQNTHRAVRLMGRMLYGESGPTR